MRLRTSNSNKELTTTNWSIKDNVKRLEKGQVSDEITPRSEKEKASVIECLKTTMEAFDNFKKGYELRMTTLENQKAKIKESIKAIIKTSCGVIGATMESFKNMICSLEEQFHLKKVVEVDANTE